MPQTHAVFFQRRAGSANSFRGFCLCGWSMGAASLDLIHAQAAVHDLDEEPEQPEPAPYNTIGWDIPK